MRLTATSVGVALLVAACALPAALAVSVEWTTANNRLHLNGQPVTLHGLGTTSTEYLLRGLGMKSWCTYQWGKAASVIEEPNALELGAIQGILKQAKGANTMPVVRIPLTASSWLGVQTAASKANMQKWPDLGQQYRTLITNLVNNYTAAGIAAIVDLHWNDDDTEQQPMALKVRSDGGPTGNAIDFWSSIGQTFGSNPLVLAELYNEPHIGDVGVYMNGNSQYAGMLEMLAAYRNHSATGMVIIAGAAAYAYDADSLVTLDKQLTAQGEKHVMYNFHPYMGPAQAGAHNKCQDGFAAMVKQVTSATDKPVIATEFGQACCATNGACESCPSTYAGKAMGYDEAVVTILKAVGGSWMPWAWRPGAGGTGGANCQDMNGGASPAGLSLVHPSNGKGADWATLWPKYK